MAAELHSTELGDPKPLADEQAETELVARFGSFLLTSTDPLQRPYVRLVDDIISSLEQDSRVASVELPEELDEGWCLPRRVFPSPAEEDGLAFSSDALHTLQFSPCLLASIHLPSYLEAEDVPTRYILAWDGFLAVVAWRVPKGRLLASFEGHVVKEVLSEALTRLDLSLYLQGCNPACEHKFAHTIVRFAPQAVETDELRYSEARLWAEVDAHCPKLDDDDDLVGWFFTDLLVPIRSFAVLKNLGRRILELESDGRGRLSDLMQINFRRARLSTIPRPGRVRERWLERGWLHRSRHLIARVWLMLSNIEMLRRDWGAERFQFERVSDSRGVRLLFERDYSDEVDRVASLDLEPVRTAVQEAAERLDSRAHLRATTLAAIGAAVVGGVIGGLASGGL